MLFAQYRMRYRIYLPIFYPSQELELQPHLDEGTQEFE
jgi:hypothetical protein